MGVWNDFQTLEKNRQSGFFKKIHFLHGEAYGTPIEKCHFLHFHSSASNELRYKKSMTVGKLLKREIWCKNPHPSIFIRLRAVGEQSYISYDTPIEKCHFLHFHSSASDGLRYKKSMTIGKLLKREIWCENPPSSIFIRLWTVGEQSYTSYDTPIESATVCSLISRI